MQALKQNISKIFKSWKKIGKNHIDFVTALLTIPVLLSVIILNYTNLQKPKTNDATPTPTSEKQQIIVVPQDKNTQNTTPNLTSQACRKDIGPVEISSPTEGENIADNPVCVIIDYTDESYCSVVWSYRINNGTWSDFSSNNPCIYNLPSGNVKFDLKIQSTVLQKEKTITRNFKYSGNNIISPAASSSAATQ